MRIETFFRLTAHRLHCLQGSISNLGIIQHGLELSALGEGVGVIATSNKVSIDPNAGDGRLSRLALQVVLNLGSLG